MDNHGYEVKRKPDSLNGAAKEKTIHFHLYILML
jgi:hypothetical protein